MSILTFSKPPYSIGDKTGTKKVFKVLTRLLINPGELKKDEKFCLNKKILNKIRTFIEKGHL